jgi:excisionase family DNA binding protein
MTSASEVTVLGVRYWANKSDQLASLLATSRGNAIPDPSGQPVQPEEIIVLTCPERWAESPRELHDALLAVVAASTVTADGLPTSLGAVAPVEDRLVFTVEEAAQLLGISRSFAYEAVQRGEIPSMRIGKRILVPKAALQRHLLSIGYSRSDENEEPTQGPDRTQP